LGEEVLGCLLRGQGEAEDGAEVGHLGGGDGVAGMSWQPRIEDVGDLWAGLEEAGEDEGVLAGAVETQGKGGEGAEGEPGFHGAGDGSGEGSGAINALCQGGVLGGDVAEE
jgi:hypothetical protein